jgi:hypothetical protein
LDLDDIWARTQSLEKCDSGGRLDDGGPFECFRVDYERNFWNRGDAVTTSKKEGRYRGGSDRGGSSKAPIDRSASSYLSL